MARRKKVYYPVKDDVIQALEEANAEANQYRMGFQAGQEAADRDLRSENVKLARQVLELRSEVRSLAVQLSNLAGMYATRVDKDYA